MAPTPGPMPVLTEATRVRTNLGTLAAVIGTIAGFAIWLTAAYSDLQQVKRDVSEIKAALHEAHLANNP